MCFDPKPVAVVSRDVKIKTYLKTTACLCFGDDGIRVN